MALINLVSDIKKYLDRLEGFQAPTEDEIYQEINDTFKLVYELTGLTSDDIEIDWYEDGSPPYVVEQFIKYTILYDKVMVNMMGKTGSVGKGETLGDYEYSVESGFSNDYKMLIDDLKEKLKFWEEKMLKFFNVSSALIKHAKSQAVVRGEANEDYPFGTRGDAF